MKGMNEKQGRASQITYHILVVIVRFCLRICHPVIRIKGLENIPQGPAVLCANHSCFTDPIWILAWCRLKRLPRTMAKKELFKSPIMSRIFSLIGAFPVDRGNTDITAIKTAMQTLKDNNKLVIFPEGTRVRKGETVEPHSGAILIAHRMKAPLVPVYLSVKKGLFRPIDLIFDTPYVPQFDTPKPDAAALEQAAKKLMDQVYDLGQPKKGGA